MVIRLRTKEIRSMGRATQGVTLVHLKDGDRVVDVAHMQDDSGNEDGGEGGSSANGDGTG